MVNVVPKEVVVGVLRAEYRDWAENLSQEEKDAIRKYSRNSIDANPGDKFFVRLNSMLRREYNKPDAEMLKKYANIISGAISKHPLKEGVALFRGCDVNPFGDVTLGTEIRFEQFLSTSVINTKAFKGKYDLRIYAPPGTVGAYIEALSAYPKQREFLLNTGCTLKLLDVEKNCFVTEVKV